MADTSITFDVKFDSKAFDKGMKSINKQLADLNKTAGRVTSSFTSLGNKGGTGLSKLNKSIDASTLKFSGFSKAAKVAMTAVTVTAGALAKNFLQTAAKTETLTVAMESVARANGIAIETMNEHKAAVMEMGIAEQEATQIMTRFMQAQLDTAYASKLARVAQDAAVIANIDSSQAAETMTEAIAKQRPELLSAFGMTKNLNAIYGDYSSTVGKTTQQLSELEKRQAIINYIMSEGQKITGTYEASMGTAGKQIGSLSRHWQTFKNTVATPFLPALASAVEVVTNALIRATSWMEANRVTLERWGHTIAQVIGMLTKTEKKAADTTKKNVEAIVPSEVSDKTSSIQKQTSAIDSQGEAIEDMAKKAKKAGKQLQGFDQLNKMSEEDSGSSVDGGGGGATIGGLGPLATSLPDLEDNNFTNSLDKISESLKKFYNEWGFVDIFEGIKRGIDQVDWVNIKINLKTTGDGLKEIGIAAFDSGERIKKAMGGLIGVSYENNIKILGSIFNSVVQGVADFIKNNKDNITEWIDEITISLENSIGNMTETFGIMGNVIFESFERNKERISSSIEGILGAVSNLASGAVTLISDILEITTGKLLTWIEENEVKLGEAYDGVIRIFTDLIDGISDIINGLVNILRQFWEDYGKEIYDGIVDVITSVMTWILDFFNDTIMPIWDNLVETFSRVWEENLEPMLSALMEFVGEVGLLLKALWDNYLKPLIDFLVGIFGPMFKWVFNTIVNVVGKAVGILSNIISGILKILKGVISFITGVFTGDWQKAWDGIKDIFGGVFDGIVAILKGTVNVMIDLVNGLISKIFDGVNLMSGALSKFQFDVPDWVPAIGGTKFGIDIPKIEAPQIPRLAKGGLIPPRKPRQVIVGDNMSEDEIVSPVSTMKSAVRDVIDEMGGLSNNAQILNTLMQILRAIEDGHVIELDDREFGRSVVRAAQGIRGQTGKSLL